MPAGAWYRRGDHLAGLGVEGAGAVDHADHIQRMVEAGGDRCLVAVIVGVDQASGIQRGHAGGLVGEAEEVHGDFKCEVELLGEQILREGLPGAWLLL